MVATYASSVALQITADAVQVHHDHKDNTDSHQLCVVHDLAVHAPSFQCILARLLHAGERLNATYTGFLLSSVKRHVLVFCQVRRGRCRFALASQRQLELRASLNLFFVFSHYFSKQQ